MKKIFKLFVVCLSVIVLVTGCGNKKEEKEESIVNTNEHVIKDQTVDNFKFENTSLLYENESSVFETTITNISDEDAKIQEIEIIVKDRKGNEIVTLYGFVGSVILAKDSKVITSYCREDLREAYSINYKIVK